MFFLIYFLSVHTNHYCYRISPYTLPCKTTLSLMLPFFFIKQQLKILSPLIPLWYKHRGALCDALNVQKFSFYYSSTTIPPIMAYTHLYAGSDYCQMVCRHRLLSASQAYASVLMVWTQSLEQAVLTKLNKLVVRHCCYFCRIVITQSNNWHGWIKGVTSMCP